MQELTAKREIINTVPKMWIRNQFFYHSKLLGHNRLEMVSQFKLLAGNDIKDTPQPTSSDVTGVCNRYLRPINLTLEW